MESVRNRMTSSRILIIGAGWAGISAAHSLMLAGVPGEQIVMLERAPRAGGRAFSFTDKEQGLDLDNGQHVLLGCCDQFVQLLGDMNIANAYRFQQCLNIPVYCEGAWGQLFSKRLAGALHLLPGLLSYAHLGMLERVRALRAAPGFLHPDVEALDAMSFGDWLRKNGQTERTIRRLWDLVGTAVLNGHVDQISAGLAAESFRMGVVAGWQQARLGLFTRPLGDLADDAVSHLQRQGVTVRFHTAVDSLLFEGNRVKGARLRDGQNWVADAVISAVPHDALWRMLPDVWQRHADFQGLQQLAWSPILNAFILYDRRVTQHDVFASTQLGGMFVFNRAALVGEDRLDGRWLSISISAADRYRALSHEEIGDMVAKAIAEALPEARAANVEHCKVVWQPRATFLASPGTAGKRLNPISAVSGLLIAGDWTNTGWPASLEGAVRSGQAAVEAWLRGGRKQPDLPMTS
ncbi:phytoene dehydrogenase [Alicyclobacillus acidoterrestris]|uniref:hydroxysqualene dehydroxylase HpnE n=1 Tax=Alicyclobacillus suci TaxID=2816080 RepID=UPI0011960B46|nr:hydroxysqualene dehydroxylase HpnE [Alicyclobacillus suci]GEO25970.1 phytoene dehydrogenase [Alicyclobacillus acidoterrestris]